MPYRTSRRVVTVSTIAARRGRPRLWAFGYADLAQLPDCSEGAVRQLVKRDRLNPRDLASVCAAWKKRRRPDG
jgi:hypothetical protein